MSAESPAGREVARSPLVRPAEWLGVVLVFLLLAWLGVRGDDWRSGYSLTGQKSDYYNLLVDGLLEGHLHLKVAPGADGQMPYLLDASLYQGKYYLYFGVVPAVTVFLPYSLLTGNDLSGNCATLVLVMGGFLLSGWLAALCRQRYFPGLSGGPSACLLGLLAFGAGTPILVIASGFYEIALAGGYLFLCGTLLGLYQALHSARRGRWLALASLSAGLAAGCRPTSIVLLPLLLLPVWWHGRSGTGEPAPARRRRQVTLLGAAIIPAGLIGLLLMAYNQARFADPFETGFRYQVSELIRSGLPVARLEFIWSNLRAYYFRPPTLSPFFPFCLPVNTAANPPLYYGVEMVHGQWLALVLALWCAGAALWLRLRGRPWPAEFRVFAGGCLAAFAAGLLVLSCFGFRANRYVVDFQTALVVLLALAGGFTAAHLPPVGPAAGRFFRVGFAALVALLAAFNVCAGLQTSDILAHTRTRTFQQVSRWANLPAHAYWRWNPGQFQSYRAQVKFARPDRAREEVLLATGTLGYLDELLVTSQVDGTVSFRVAHVGRTALGTGPIRVDFDRPHDLEILIGSFFPAPEHPFFAGWSATEVIRARTITRVLLDGVEIIDGHQAFFAAQPGRTYWGANPWTNDPPFSGRILRVEPRPLPGRGDMQAAREFGLWRFTWQIDPFSGQPPQPLLASGTAGAGNLLLLEHRAPDTIGFALDEWGCGLTRSGPITLKPDRPHTLELFVGPQVARQTLAPEWQVDPAALAQAAPLLQVWIDGNLAWQTTVRCNRESYDFVALGKNPQGFSSAIATHLTLLAKQPLLPDERRDLLRRCLAVTPAP